MCSKNSFNVFTKLKDFSKSPEMCRDHPTVASTIPVFVSMETPGEFDQ